MTPFKALTFRDLRVASSYGPVPELRWLTIDRLVIDESYQRVISDVGRQNIAVIAETFDWRKFSPAIVAPVEGGSYAVIDGQHRTHAALLCGITSIPCVIIQADSQEQARSFAAINARITRVQPQQILKAQFKAGDAELHEVVKLAEAQGLHIIWHNQATADMGPRETCAISALVSIYRKGGASLLQYAIIAICACQLPKDRTIFTAGTLRIFAEALALRRDWRDKAFLDKALRDLVIKKLFADIEKRRLNDPLLSRIILGAEAVQRILQKAAPEKTSHEKVCA